MKVAYPVIFTETDTNILIEVPDLGIMTQANDESEEKGSISDAISIVRDAIGIHCIETEDSDEVVESPSELFDMDVTKGEFYGLGKTIISLVDVDLIAYRKMLDNKMVRRNVTLPNWLNKEAEKAKINVSRILQEALMQTLGLQR